MKKFLLLHTMIVTALVPLLGQSHDLDSDVLEARRQGVQSHYTDRYPANILTGKLYTNQRNQFKQFFLGKYIENGSLVFDGVLFEDIELQYNLYEQNLVVLLETESTERYITVTLDKVSWFSIYGHEFTQVAGDSVMEKGIYELAYDGANSSVFIKRKFNESSLIVDRKVTYEYTPVNDYYVKNEFGTFPVANKKELLQAYGNSRKLNSIIKKHKVRFSKKRIEHGLVTAISALERAGDSTKL